MMLLIEQIRVAQMAAEAPGMLASLDWLDRLTLETGRWDSEPAICIEECEQQTDDEFSISFVHFPLEMMKLLRESAHRVFGVGTAQFFTS